MKYLRELIFIIFVDFLSNYTNKKKGISEINSMLMLLNLTLIGWDQDKDLFPMTKFDSNF